MSPVDPVSLGELLLDVREDYPELSLSEVQDVVYEELLSHARELDSSFEVQAQARARDYLQQLRERAAAGDQYAASFYEHYQREGRLTSGESY